jgi:hypothetical protein
MGPNVMAGVIDEQFGVFSVTMERATLVAPAWDVITLNTNAHAMPGCGRPLPRSWES